MFWTKAIDDDSFEIEPGEGSARWSLRRYAITDYTRFENAISAFSGPGGTPTPEKALLPPRPAMVSFELRWEGVKRRYTVDNPSQQLRGKFVEPAQATINWSSTTNGYSFASSSTTDVFFAQVGEERNGVFFRRLRA